MTVRSDSVVRGLWQAALLVALAFAPLGRPLQGEAQGAFAPAVVGAPAFIGGASGSSDARDADIYPSIAYDTVTRRYLVVWLSARNAGSSSDGLDVYGRFLDRLGRAQGSEFRISDSNTAARSDSPRLVAGSGEFAVVWAARGTYCRVLTQRVTDSAARTDQVLVSGSSHAHSPAITYNPQAQSYALAYVQGDDYMPPTMFGAQTADCGNNATSASRIQAMGFRFEGEAAVAAGSSPVSDSVGGFRPQIAYNAGLGQYLVVWEDRRGAGSEACRFDVYAQRLAGLAESGVDLPLATGADYTNLDTSATWTPRPVVAAGVGRFLVLWFDRQAMPSAVLWSVMGASVPASGAASAPLTYASMSFAQAHTGQAPAGFLSLAYSSDQDDYLFGFSSHLESLWGYFSLALVQRLSGDGQLLKLDGTPQDKATVGSSVDYSNDDQTGIAVCANPVSGEATSDFVVVYGRHPMLSSSHDFDIWGVRLAQVVPPVYAAGLEPATPAVYGPPGRAANHVLYVTNNGNIWDTYSLSASDTSWAVRLPPSVGPIEAGTTVAVGAMVSIPVGAAMHSCNVTSVAAVSQADGSKRADATLTTTVVPSDVYLPTIRRNYRR